MEVLTKKTKEISDWFENTNLIPYDYQINIIDELLNTNNDVDKPKLLAACPSAGKTLMSICFVDLYLKENPTHNVLILAHGTKVLRTQFYDEIKKIKDKISFTATSLESSKDYITALENNNVIVTLPQTLSGCNDIKKNDFDLIIVDEAHEFYFADTVQSLFKKIKPKRILPLTGSPSKFILKEHPLVAVTVNQLLEIPNRISDVVVELASSSYNFDYDDYNHQTDELLTKAHQRISKKDTYITLDELLSKVIGKLKSVWRANPKAYTTQKNITGWSDALKSLNKTMIACKNQKQAKLVKQYLDDKNIDSALSISDTDSESDEIKRFLDEKECVVLIVVGRGILGFNMPELENVIDMSCTMNIDRIFQLMTRALRAHPEGKKKLFFKVVPNYLAEYNRYLMTFVLLLTDIEYFTKYNGKNFLQMSIPIKKKTTTKNDDGDTKKKKYKSNKEFKPIVFEDIPAVEFFKDLLHKDKSLLTSYAYTTMQEVRKQCFNIKNRSMTTKEFIERAKKIHF